MDLERHAAAIPSMGGRQIGVILRNLARTAPADTAIVELGAWLGSGTAQLALGLRDRSENRVSIHCFDRFTVLECDVRKAKLEGVKLAVGQPTLPIVQETLEPFGVPITFTQGDLRNAKWSGPPISVYIDDATKTAMLFLPLLEGVRTSLDSRCYNARTYGLPLLEKDRQRRLQSPEELH
jgi:hypothetical protein